jgi:hypothetical protein
LRSRHLWITSGAGRVMIIYRLAEYTGPETQDMSPLPYPHGYQRFANLPTTATLTYGYTTKPLINVLGLFYQDEETHSPLTHSAYSLVIPYWLFLLLSLLGLIPLCRRLVVNLRANISRFEVQQ